MITSTSNPLIRQVRALRQRKVRTRTGLFLVEGIHPVGEAIEAGWKIDTILYAPDSLISAYGRDLLARHPAGTQPVSAAIMETVSDKDNPQGVLAVVHARQTGLQAVGSVRVAVAAVSPQDAGNVGTVLRTLDAVGVDALFLLEGGVDPYHPGCVRASMGAIFWKPVIQAGFAEFVAWVRAGTYQLVGASAHAAQNYQSFRPRLPWILLLGSEQKGLSGEQLEACEAVVSLPMRGRASSLNLSVAAGILLYEYGTRS